MKTAPLYLPNIFLIEEELGLNKLLKHFDEKSALFIVTPAVQKIISFAPKQGTLTAGYSFLKEEVDGVLPELWGISKIVAVGASKILDQAKYIASQLNIPLVLIPSILSTNSFSTGWSVLKVNNKPMSIRTKVSEEVYIVWDLLHLAPKKYNKYGLIDVLSIYTAIKDWDIAIADDKDDLALEYYIARNTLDAFLSSKLENDFYDISKLLLLSGFVVSTYEDGRPESGSEHIIAKAIEGKVECFHAHSVSFGMLVSMKLQDSWNQNIIDSIRKIVDWGSDDGKSVLTMIETNLLSSDIKPRDGRYTILDKVDGNQIETAIKEVLAYLKS